MAAKTFGPVFVSFDGSDTMQYAFGYGGAYGPHIPVQTPVDTMLAALGACIVKSLEWAAGQRKVALSPFQVQVVARKAEDMPGRLQHAQITIIGEIVEDKALADRMIKQAKSICTVSNTLNCDVYMDVQ